MADRNQYRPPNRSDREFWADRSEEGDREGDRSAARNYDREDMRGYARRSVEQGERLRRSRGEPPEYRWTGPQRSHQREWDDRELYRGYGTTIAQRYGRDVDPDIERQRAAERRDRERGAGDRDFPYDYEDIGNERDTDTDTYGNFYGERQRSRSERQGPFGDERSTPGGFFSSRVGQRRAGGTGEENRWGSGDPGGYGQGGRGQGGQNQTPDLGGGSDYDMDPGFSYEFGTRWDFDRDAGYGDRRTAHQYRDRGQQYTAPGQRGRGQMEDWQIPGPYTGVGPQGYRPSDERLQDRLCEVFTRHGKIDARDINIKVQDGNVTLNGAVNRKLEKYLAEEIASSISGVNEVDNRLRVKG